MQVIQIFFAMLIAANAGVFSFSAARHNGQALTKLQLTLHSGFTSPDTQISEKLNFELATGAGDFTARGANWNCEFKFEMRERDRRKFPATLEQVKICQDSWEGAEDAGDRIVSLFYGSRAIPIRVHDGERAIENYFCDKKSSTLLLEGLKTAIAAEELRHCPKERIKLVESMFRIP